VSIFWKWRQTAFIGVPMFRDLMIEKNVFPGGLLSGGVPCGQQPADCLSDLTWCLFRPSVCLSLQSTQHRAQTAVHTTPCTARSHNAVCYLNVIKLFFFYSVSPVRIWKPWTAWTYVTSLCFAFSLLQSLVRFLVIFQFIELNFPEMFSVKL
jgi:hypothetical protein